MADVFRQQGRYLALDKAIGFAGDLLRRSRTPDGGIR